MVYCEGVEVESKLAKLLQSFRCDRPSELLMDDFIRLAEEMHQEITRLREAEKDAARMNWLESNGFSIEMADYNHVSCNRVSIDQAMKEKCDE